MSNTLQANGGQPQKPVRFTPIFTGRYFQGLWTQRSPLRDAGSTRLEEKYYGARGDAMIAGINAEISPRLTPVRRPGNSIYNSASFSSVDRFYEFRLFGPTTENIKVMADQADALYDATGPSTKTSVWTKSTGAGPSYMQSVGNTLFFANGIDQKKWLQSVFAWTANTPVSPFMSTFFIDSNGDIEQLLACVVPVVSTGISGNEATVTFDRNVDSILQVGLEIKFTGLTTSTFLNNQTVTLSTVSGTDVTFPFNNADTGPSPDTGIGTVLQGGNPSTDSDEPTWAGVGSTTQDGTALWINRGSPIQNWGIQSSSQALIPNVGGNAGSWATNTYYSPDGLIIVNNSGTNYLLQVTTAGLSGVSEPAWNLSLSATTNDNTVLWTCIQVGTDWQAHNAYDPTTDPPPYIIATAGGVPCLFKAIRGRGINIIDDPMHPGNPVTVTYYGGANGNGNNPSGTNFGNGGNSEWSGFSFSYPSTSFVTNTYHVTSLLYNPFAQTPATVDGHNFHQSPGAFAVLNGAGEITGYNQLIGGQREIKYALAFSCALNVPVAGNYSFTIPHDDGMFFGIDGGATLISGPKNNPYGQTVTAVNNYPILGAQNVSGSTTETYIVNFPTAGTYNFELDLSQWEGGATCCVTMGSNIVSGTFESAGTAPNWPAWTTTGAPAKPSVFDASTNAAINFINPSSQCLQWQNQGPISDMVWRASTHFALGGGIVDTNANGEVPFQSGVSGNTAPTWRTGINNLTADAPNLIWINTGTAPAAPAGTVSTYLGGWRYSLALVNSLDNTVSNATPMSIATGNFVGAEGVTIGAGTGLPAVIDPQVDYVAIFRTVDGGATPFLIPGTDNCLIATLTLSEYQSSGYTDTAADTGLNNLLEGPILQENTPPLSGAINLAFHLNRIFFSVGNTVYWTSGADSPIGNGINGYSPINFAEFPSLVTRIVPTSIGALVFTVSDIYVIGGNASTSPLFPAQYAAGVGLLNYNALDVSGTIIYMYTADREVLRLDVGAGGADRVGFPISDQFRASNWDPNNVYVTWHQDGDDIGLFVADGVGTWYHMLPTPAPETGVTWCPLAVIGGGCKAVQSIEVSPGVHKLLVGPTASGNILERDLTSFTDNGTTYTMTFTIGSIVLANGGQLAEISHITALCPAVGSMMELAIILDEAMPYYTDPFESLGHFTNEPPNLPPSKSLYRQRFYLSQNEDTAVCQDIQMQFTWPAEDAQSELLATTIFGAYLQEE